MEEIWAYLFLFFSVPMSGSTTPASGSPPRRRASGTAPPARPRWPGRREESEEEGGKIVAGIFISRV